MKEGSLRKWFGWIVFLANTIFFILLIAMLDDNDKAIGGAIVFPIFSTFLSKIIAFYSDSNPISDNDLPGDFVNYVFLFLVSYLIFLLAAVPMRAYNYFLSSPAKLAMYIGFLQSAFGVYVIAFSNRIFKK